ncbi:MAG: CpaF family protein [Bradymonadaceae bacterium]
MIPENIFQQSIRRYFEPIRPFLDDDDIAEVMINGKDEIWIEVEGELEKTDLSFDTKDDLMGGVKQIAQFVGKPLNEHNPRMDARLPNGSRVHVLLPPCARNGITVSIRQFGEFTLDMETLKGFGSIDDVGAEFLRTCIELRKNIVVAGGTGSGKTSLLNCLSLEIDNRERILVIEDNTELQLEQDHVVMMETKKADDKGRGEVGIGDLFHSAMRLRPDRIVIGEIRGGEALTLLQAMTSGHGGTLTTTHATYPSDTLRRLETMSMMADIDMKLRALRSQVASAIDVIVQTSRFNDGSRKITHITECMELGENGEYQTYPLYKFFNKGEADDGTVLGDHEPCGNLPTFMDQAEAQGIPCPREWFDKPGEKATPRGE